MKKTNTNWILTYSGKEFNPFQIDQNQIEIIDIAHALSNICRFTGHCKQFYSVAQHCVYVAEKIYLETLDSKKALYGLLHDASEAYLCDIAKPIKDSDVFENYRQIENGVENAIWKRFGMDFKVPEIVKATDAEILDIEAFYLMPKTDKWTATVTDPKIVLNKWYAVIDMPFNDEIPYWSQRTAKERFLNATLNYGLKTK